ncbi:MAG: hypothetical protein ACRDZ4_06345 [Egibacteraceae bacterium]
MCNLVVWSSDWLGLLLCLPLMFKLGERRTYALRLGLLYMSGGAVLSWVNHSPDWLYWGLGCWLAGSLLGSLAAWKGWPAVPLDYGVLTFDSFTLDSGTDCDTPTGG